MFKQNVIRSWIAGGLVIAAAGLAATAQAKGVHPPAPPPFCAPAATACNTPRPGAWGPAVGPTAKEKRAAASVTRSQANAMQAAAVAHGQANSALSNPYIEQKVTTPESVGVNLTKVPAGGF